MSCMSDPRWLFPSSMGRLHPTSSSSPFEMWGMDVTGPINPPTSIGHRFILAITDYFSKLAEAVPLKEVKTPNFWLSSSSITCFTASVYPDESSTIMGLNSLAKHSSDSVTNSKSKVCHLRHTIQSLTGFQKPLTRLLVSFSRNFFWRVNVTRMTN